MHTVHKSGGGMYFSRVSRFFCYDFSLLTPYHYRKKFACIRCASEKKACYWGQGPPVKRKRKLANASEKVAGPSRRAESSGDESEFIPALERLGQKILGEVQGMRKAVEESAGDIKAAKCFLGRIYLEVKVMSAVLSNTLGSMWLDDSFVPESSESESEDQIEEGEQEAAAQEVAELREEIEEENAEDDEEDEESGEEDGEEEEEEDMTMRE